MGQAKLAVLREQHKEAQDHLSQVCAACGLRASACVAPPAGRDVLFLRDSRGGCDKYQRLGAHAWMD